MNSGKLLLGIIIGAAAGVLTGILIAPEKGAETRDRLAEMSEDYLDTFRDSFDNILDNMNSKFEQIRKDISKVAEKK